MFGGGLLQIVVRFYFYSFIVIIELVLVNIIVGFIIDLLDVYMSGVEDEGEGKGIVDLLLNRHTNQNTPQI